MLVDDSSYTWWLRQQIADRSDADGNCAPCFDFCYLDDAHNWTIDGLAVILVEKLLRPGAWLLLDDLNWFYEPERSSFGPGQSPADLGVSESECAQPHMRAVYELLVQQHPSFTTFHEEGGEWDGRIRTPPHRGPTPWPGRLGARAAPSRAQPGLTASQTAHLHPVAGWDGRPSRLRRNAGRDPRR